MSSKVICELTLRRYEHFKFFQQFHNQKYNTTGILFRSNNMKAYFALKLALNLEVSDWRLVLIWLEKCKNNVIILMSIWVCVKNTIDWWRFSKKP